MKTVAQTVIEADRFYTIAAHTGNVIQAVEDAQEGAVRLGKYDHKPEQEWSFDRVGEGAYRIRNRATGKLLDLMMTGTANGTWLHLWEDVSGTSQMWTVEPTPAGAVRLRSAWAGGKCVDTVGMGAELGAVLQIWQEVAEGDQLWTITEVKDRAKRSTKKEEPVAEVVETVEAAVVEAAPVEEPVVEAPAAVVEETVEQAAPVVEEKAAEVVAPVVEEKTAEEAPAQEPVKAEEAAPVAAKAAPAAKKPAAKKTSRAKRKAATKKK